MVHSYNTHDQKLLPLCVYVLSIIGRGMESDLKIFYSCGLEAIIIL